MKHKPEIQGDEERCEYYFSQTPESIQGIIYLQGEEIVQQPHQDYRKKDDAGSNGKMYPVPLTSQKFIRVERTVHQHKGKKEYRQHYYMKKLGYESTENLGYRAHF
jgi:hypothetical protein